MAATDPSQSASIGGAIHNDGIAYCGDAPDIEACGNKQSSNAESVAHSSEATLSAHGDGASCDGPVVVHEGPSAVVHRIRLEDGRTVAAKSLIGEPEPSVDDICRLNNECNILSGLLAKCASGVRKVIGRASDDGVCDEVELVPDSKLLLKRYGRHTLFLEWVEGISVAEWMSRVRLRLEERNHDEMKEAEIINEIVELMRGIATALAAVHEAGVLHNDVAAEHFVVQPGGTGVKIIGFGYAAPMSMQEVDDEGVTVNDDLFCLGVIFRDLLKTGLGMKRKSKRRRQNAKRSTSVSSMSRTSITNLANEEYGLEGVPRCLATLVYSLTKNCSERTNLAMGIPYLPEPQYTSATEVAEVLGRMLFDPRAFLCHKNEETRPSINFPVSVLYGRSKQSGAILDVYRGLSCPDQVGGVRPRMVLVTGSAGVGKSALLQRLGSFVEQTDNGIFAYGKYDQLMRNEPYSALVAALDSLCKAILLRGRSATEKVKKDIEMNVGAEVGVLMQLIPSLSQTMAGEEREPIATDVTSLHGLEAQNRFKFVFRMFARAMASPERPVVLALDDLQWADEASLNLIRSIMTDQGNSSPLLIAASYRHEELGEDHPLLNAAVGDIDGMEEIEVANLNFEELNAMISDALHVPRLVTCSELTRVILHKTQGNAFFAKQFLLSLVDNDLLVFDTNAWRWAWDMETVSSMSVTDNVLGLLTSKICDRLSGPVREVLELAACLGSVFDMPTLQLIVEALPSQVTPIGQATVEKEVVENHQRYHNLNCRIDSLLEEGLLVMVTNGVRYRFAHDRIQQAAYDVIPGDRKAALHLRIGELIWKKLQQDRPRLESLLNASETFFLAVDQMNKGSTEVVEEGGRVTLAELNLKAGQICIDKTAFQQAASYLEVGISLMDIEACFEDHYSLSLQLHNAAIEAFYCSGRFGELLFNMVARVLANAKTFADKFHAYKNLVRALGAQDKLREALETGLEVLELLGERFPRKEPVPKGAVLLDLMKTKVALRGKSDEMLLSLPPMVDQKKVFAMEIFATLMKNAYLAREDLVPLIVFRMVRLSIRYGVCKATAFAFSAFGLISAGALGDVRGGFRFGQLALLFLKKTTAKDYVAKVNLVVHYFINHWTVPLSQSVRALQDSSRIGMEAGDIDHAIICAQASLTTAFYAGESLNVLEEKAKSTCHKVVECSTQAVTTRILPLWQMILNLMGRNDNPLDLTGEVMTRDEYLAEALRTNTKHDTTLVHLYSSYLAYIFGEYQLSAELAEKARDVKETNLGSFHVCIQAYVEGLSALALARYTKSRKWKTVARRAFRKLKKWSVSSPNLVHKRIFLEAEFAALIGKKRKALKSYEAAILAAAKMGCTQDEALLYERAGFYLSELGDGCKASQRLVQAHQCYLKWGAQCKADRLYAQHMIRSS